MEPRDRTDEGNGPSSPHAAEGLDLGAHARHVGSGVWVGSDLGDEGMVVGQDLARRLQQAWSNAEVLQRLGPEALVRLQTNCNDLLLAFSRWSQHVRHDREEELFLGVERIAKQAFSLSLSFEQLGDALRECEGESHCWEFECDCMNAVRDRLVHGVVLAYEQELADLGGVFRQNRDSGRMPEALRVAATALRKHRQLAAMTESTLMVVRDRYIKSMEASNCLSREQRHARWREIEELDRPMRSAISCLEALHASRYALVKEACGVLVGVSESPEARAAVQEVVLSASEHCAWSWTCPPDCLDALRHCGQWGGIDGLEDMLKKETEKLRGERRRILEAERSRQGKCIMCGRTLGILQRWRRVKQHASCKVFIGLDE